MNTKQFWIVGLSMVLGCILLGWSLNNLAAEQVTSSPTAVGRYQMSLKPMGPSTTVFILDTHSGRCWYRETSREDDTWTDFGSPLAQLKK
jgi:hypothetical protein